MSYRVGLLTKFVLNNVEAERERQLDRWGVQHHKDGTGGNWDDFEGQSFQTMANIAREACDSAAREGRVTWLHILLEEVFDVPAESDPEALTKELIQVAAVAVAWAEDIRSRK